MGNNTPHHALSAGRSGCRPGPDGHHRRGDIPGWRRPAPSAGPAPPPGLGCLLPRAGRQVFLEVKGIFVAGQLHGGHLVLLHHLDELGVGNLLGAGVGNLLGQEIKENDQDQGPENGPENKAAFARALAAALCPCCLDWNSTVSVLRSGGAPPFFWFMSFAGRVSHRAWQIVCREKLSPFDNGMVSYFPFYCKERPVT